MAQLGGRVEAGHHREFGRAFVTPTDTHDPLFTGLFQTGREEVWMSHGDRVTALAPGFAVIGTSPNAPFAITADPARHFYAVQFHPEVHHTVNGARILQQLHRPRRLHRRLDDGRLQGPGDRRDPRPGRRRPGHLRPLRRRRLARSPPS